MAYQSGQSPPSAPAWTVPLDGTPTADSEKLVNTMQEDDSSRPSAPNINDLPPNYYDISIVPNNAVLHYNEVTPYTESSKAEIERQSEGVLSLDPLIDRNPDQLWLYFMTYLNERPSLAMQIHGYHIEHYTTYERVRTADGNYHTHPVHRTRHVTDFRFSYDLTGYVSSQWWRVAVIPSQKTMKAGQYVSLRDAVEQYTHSDKKIKDIVCQKQLLGWDFQDLTYKIKAIIRSTGYHNHINVSFSVKNNRIAARSSSAMSRFSNSTLVRVLCVISCLFLIFGPIYLCLRAAGSTKDQIVADYTMLTTSDAFLQMNAGAIANAAMARSTQHYVAYLA